MAMRCCTWSNASGSGMMPNSRVCTCRGDTTAPAAATATAAVEILDDWESSNDSQSVQSNVKEKGNSVSTS